LPPFRVRRHIEYPCDQSWQLAKGPETTVGPLGKVDGFLRTKQPFNKTVNADEARIDQKNKITRR
jgi:hypothetical protein